jgi:hypothetical protein
MGTVVKNAPNASSEIPPKVNSIPPIIVRMAIIITPIGRLIYSAKLCNELFDKDLNKKNFEIYKLFLILQ